MIAQKQSEKGVKIYTPNTTTDIVYRLYIHKMDIVCGTTDYEFFSEEL